MTYKDVTILQFQRFHSAVIHHGFSFDDGSLLLANIYEIGMEILNIFEDVPIAESKLWKVKYFDKRLEKYAFLLNSLPSDEWVKEFEFNGNIYKVKQTPDQWNTAQFVSMANLTKDRDKIMDVVHIIVAVMCTDDDSHVIQRSREFQDGLSIAIAYPLALFFCAVMLKLPPSTLRYLKARVK